MAQLGSGCCAAGTGADGDGFYDNCACGGSTQDQFAATPGLYESGLGFCKDRPVHLATWPNVASVTKRGAVKAADCCQETHIKTPPTPHTSFVPVPQHFSLFALAVHANTLLATAAHASESAELAALLDTHSATPLAAQNQ